MKESILSILQEEGELTRVVLVHRHSFGGSQVVLRRESFSDDVGWFEQSSIDLSPGQVGQLKQAIGVLPMSKARMSIGPSRKIRQCTSMTSLALPMVSQNAG